MGNHLKCSYCGTLDKQSERWRMPVGVAPKHGEAGRSRGLSVKTDCVFLSQRSKGGHWEGIGRPEGWDVR